MHQDFNFSFIWPRRLMLSGVLMVVVVLGYHKIVQNSIRKHPETTRLAVQEHCRYLLGKQVGKMPRAELNADFQRCQDIRVTSVKAAGGLFDPVIVKITIESQPRILQDRTELIFKSAAINSGKFNFLSSLHCLLSGHWTFNYYTTYSRTTFYGSF
jgi:hypothetical protein